LITRRPPVLGNTRKTVAVSSAPPQGRRCSYLVWRLAAAPVALERHFDGYLESLQRIGFEVDGTLKLPDALDDAVQAVSRLTICVTPAIVARPQFILITTQTVSSQRFRAFAWRTAFVMISWEQRSRACENCGFKGSGRL